MLSNSICVQYCLYVNFKVQCNYLFLVSLIVSLLLLTTAKAQCEGFSTWFRFKCVGLCSNSDTDNWKCSTCSIYVSMSFKILFLVSCSHTLFLIGQHTLHNFYITTT